MSGIFDLSWSGVLAMLRMIGDYLLRAFVI